jgi:CheY-like chemotaxis protein
MTAFRVLHVDDDSDIREVVSASLGLDSDVVTRSCASGQEALAVAAEWQPDIILLDVMMPAMDGPATLARLRKSVRTADIPVVFMTARAQSREIEFFRSLGAAGVIAKPFDPVTLASSVRHHVRTIDVRLRSMQTVFLRRLREDAARLASRRSALEDKTAAQAALGEIKDIAHGLAGAGSIFGFSEIGDAAAVLEETVAAELKGSEAAGDIAGALDRLLACIDANIVPHTAQSSFSLDAQGFRQTAPAVQRMR